MTAPTDVAEAVAARTDVRQRTEGAERALSDPPTDVAGVPVPERPVIALCAAAAQGGEPAGHYRGRAVDAGGTRLVEAVERGTAQGAPARVLDYVALPATRPSAVRRDDLRAGANRLMPALGHPTAEGV